MNKDISTISLRTFTNQNTSTFHFVASNDNNDLYQKLAHRRDDHYLFIFQKKGHSKIVVDFKEVDLIESSIICILPGQVHSVTLVTSNTEAWLMTVDINLINKNDRVILEESYFYYKSIVIDETNSRFLNSCMELLVFSEETSIRSEVICSLTSTCVCHFAQIYKQLNISKVPTSRKHIITKQFKSLLLKHYKTHKSVKDYAVKLSITAAYLNEAVKKVTGLTVSFWIQQMILTEAKRLLYATDNNVKEIAYQLGFDDYAYFNRYFSNFEKVSPLQFRKNCRK